MRKQTFRCAPLAAIAITFCALILSSVTANAQGFAIPETGFRKNAMGAVIGRPDEPSAVYHNPAGLADQRGTRIYLSFGSVFLGTKFRLRPWPRSDEFLNDPVDADGYYPTASPSTFAAIPMIVASTNLWSEKLVGALAIYVPNAAGASFDEDSVARYHMIDAFIVAGFATASLAYKVTPWLSVGAGFSVGYARIQSQRKIFSADLAGNDLKSLLGKDSVLEISGDDVVPVANFGILARPHPSLSLGFAFISGYSPKLTGDIKIKTGKDTIFRGDTFSGTHETTTRAPWLFFFGANWDVTRWLEIGAELRYYTNSVVKEQVTKVNLEILPQFDELRQLKNWRDNFQASGGVNIKPLAEKPLELMAGIHYQRAASPRYAIVVEAPSYDHVGLHLGARYEWQRYRFGLAYAHYRYLERGTEHSVTIPPTNFIGSGHSNILTVVFEAKLGEGIGL